MGRARRLLGRAWEQVGGSHDMPSSPLFPCLPALLPLPACSPPPRRRWLLPLAVAAAASSALAPRLRSLPPGLRDKEIELEGLLMWGCAKDAAEPEVDVSSEGTLVWVRRPNGAWWPGRVISPLDVPDGCPAPPRAPATPIMLLGRRDGPTFVDWCNLERTKRVKPFRCGELDFDECISKAEEQAARRRGSSKRTYNKGRYARKEDAILQALEIERARFRDAASKNRTKSKMGNGVGTKSSHDAARGHCDAPSSSSVNPPSRKTKKRKTPNDSEDDVPQGFRRMRDLSDIGLKTAPNHIPNAGTFSDFSYDLPSTSQVKRSKQSHATAKRKHTSADQDQPCGSLRKKDRSRPLSELCNGDMWNGFRLNGPKVDEHSMDMGSCSGSSSGTSSLGTTLLAKSSSRRSGASKTDQAKGTEISCMTGLLDDDIPHGDKFVDTPLTAGSILEADNLQMYRPCASTKDPIWKCSKQATDCSKADTSSRCDRRIFKQKIINSVDREGNNRTRNALGREHRKTRVLKYKAPSNEVALLEERVDKSSFNKHTESDDNKELAIIPADLDCVRPVLQQCSVNKREHEESSETISNHSNCENVSASSLVFELPLQVLPPQQKAPKLASWHAVKPTKTLHLNSALYDVDLSVHGSSNKGHRVPLVSLMSRSNKRPVVGYPVSVEVFDGVCAFPTLSIDYHHPATSSVNGLLNEDEAAGPQCLRSSSHMGRVKPKSHRKTSEHEMDKSWRPHTKKPVSSTRKMRRLSSFAMSQRGGEDRKSVVGKISGPTVACIPLRVVFSRINEALSYPVK